MARVIVFDNPLDASKRRRVELRAGTPLFEWLDLHAPIAAGCSRSVWVNGQRIAEGSPHRVTDADSIIVQSLPGNPGLIGYFIVQALVSAAISYVLSKIFSPSRPKAGNTPSPSQVYGLSAPRNAARLGEPIPVVYGSVIVVPDYAAQPYVEYQGNEQYLRTVLCLGQGEMEVHTMLLGDSDASALPTDVVAYQVFEPAEHASTFGLIQSVTNVRENVCTSLDVADQELLAPNQASNNVPSPWYWRNSGGYMTDTPPDMPPVVNLTGAWTPAAKLAALPPDPDIGTAVDGLVNIASDFETGALSYQVVHYVSTAHVPGAKVPFGSLIPPPGAATIGSLKPVGPFETCKAGQQAISVELDFSFPGGLYDLTGGGSISFYQVDVVAGIEPIDDSGASLGAEVTHALSWTKGENGALRFTEKIGVAAGRYRVRCWKANDTDGKPTTSERVYWTGLKAELLTVKPPGTCYGNVTLAAVVLRASNAISGDASASIRFRVTRKLQPPAGGALAETVNPADAFADIVCAPYGGNRPRNGDELDLDALAAARSRWAGHNGFNAVFDQASTVWEALGLSVQTVSAAPLPVGTRMSLIQDGVQPDRTQLFTDANMREGSLQITHAFDRDGTPVGQRVEYRDPRTFSSAALLDPPGAPDYETISLFGCTDAAVAQEHATLAANRRRLQRTTIAFDTELEGLGCLPGDRIGVQALMPRWAQVARVMEVSGVMLTLDRPLEWTEGATHAVQLRDPQGRPHIVSPVTGIRHTLYLPGPPPFAVVPHGAGMEATHLSFGIAGKEITDWTVTTMQPRGAAVSIGAVNYDPAVWAGAAVHLLATPTMRPEALL